MWRFLRPDKLISRVSSARAEVVALRQAEYRASLRLKRAAVRARLLLEVHRGQQAHVALRWARLRAAAHEQAIKGVMAAYDGRRDAVRKVLRARGVEDRLLLDVNKETTKEQEEDFEEDVVKGVQHLLTGIDAKRGGSRVAEAVLRGCVAGGAKGLADGGRAGMAGGIVAHVVKELGLERQEVSDLLRRVELQDGEGNDTGLRHAVYKAMHWTVEERKANNKSDACKM